jgi:AbrB family looped-hinge helix DNA binding protein
MDEITVSPKYQVVIPKRARKLLGIVPGQKLHVIVYAGQVVMIPVRPIQQARGALRGLEMDFERDEEDRL